MPEYAKKDYWDATYAARTDDYDWYINYSDLREHLLSLMSIEGGLNKGAKVLIVGCGNSTLPIDLYKEGFTQIECVDYSEVVISKMRAKHAALPIKFEVDDVTTMQRSADYIIDKGTLDAIACGSDSATRIGDMVDRIYEALMRSAAQGPKRFIEITFGQPTTRLPYFDKSKWDVRVDEINKSHGGHVYVYNCVPIRSGSCDSGHLAEAVIGSATATAVANFGCPAWIIILIIVTICVLLIIYFLFSVCSESRSTHIA